MMDRSWARAWQGALMSVGTLVQAVTLYSHPEPQRDIGIAPDLLLLVVAVKHVLVPLFGRTESLALSYRLSDSYRDGLLEVLPLLTAIGTASALIVSGAVAWRARNV